jgi:hypothetical protein
VGEYPGNSGLPGRIGDVKLEKINMETHLLSSKQMDFRLKTILTIALVIIIIFWFGILTDYSWNIWWLNFLFPIMVGAVSIFTLFIVKYLTGFGRWIISIVCVLSILMSALCALFFLPDLFIPSLSTHRDGILIQKENSPNGTKMVEAYCFTQSAHGGTDRISIRLRYKSLPFVKRDIAFYYNYPSQACKHSDDQIVVWENDNKLLVVHKKVELAVGLIDWTDLLYNNGATNGVY